MSRSSKLVQNSETNLGSMQGSMCRIRTLGGRSPLDKGRSRCKGYVKGVAWIEMRQAQATCLITQKQGAGVNLNKATKTHEMQSQLDIYKGVPGENPT